MQCRNHPEITTTVRCAGCGEPFCPACLHDDGGRDYCEPCRRRRAEAGQPSGHGPTPCVEADDALKYALLSLLCGLVLAPLAIAKGVAARKRMDADPQLTGAGKVRAALTLGILFLALWVLGLLVYIYRAVAAHF